MNGSTSRAHRRGLTLLELLLVLAILAVVLGSGLGTFAALRVGPRQAGAVVQSALRSASSAAAEQGDGASVRFDVAASRLWVERLQTVGTWHFEGDLEGAFGLRGDGRGLEFEDGWIGRALRFSGAPTSTAAIAVRDDPAFDLSLGFAFDVFVRRAGDGGGRVFDLGRVVVLDVGARGDVRVRFTPDNDRGQGGGVVLRSPAGLVAPGRWVRVGAGYDGARFWLEVEGIPIEILEVRGRVAPLNGPLILSDPAHPFSGALDRLVVRALVRGEPIDLPKGQRFGEGTAERVVFDGDGRLERAEHATPARVELVGDDGASHTLRIGRHGMVDG